jgi:hypothetical protein
MLHPLYSSEGSDPAVRYGPRAAGGRETKPLSASYICHPRNHELTPHEANTNRRPELVANQIYYRPAGTDPLDPGMRRAGHDCRLAGFCGLWVRCLRLAFTTIVEHWTDTGRAEACESATGLFKSGAIQRYCTVPQEQKQWNA